jgi:hypothetical protein
MLMPTSGLAGWGRKGKRRKRKKMEENERKLK